MDPARTEALEAELDRIIEKRAAESKDLPTVEELWKESSRVHEEKRRREVSAAWYSHHIAMQDIHQALADEHGVKARDLLDRGEGGS